MRSESSTADIVRQIVVIVAYIATIGVNAVANILPIGGKTTGELSDQFEVFFVPAGYVFSIWSIIYLGLGAYAVYQALPAQRANPRMRVIGWLFGWSSVFNCAWILAWHFQYVGISFLIMLGILGTLIAIYARLFAAYVVASRSEKITTHWTFRIYLGWITVATIANATTLLDSVGYSGAPLAPASWAAILLLIAAAIGLVFVRKLGDSAYALVLIWAFIGIFVKFPQPLQVGYTALAMAALLLAAIILRLKS